MAGIALNFSHKTRSTAVEVAGNIQTGIKGRDTWHARAGVVLLMLTGLTLPLSTALGCTVFPLVAAAVWLASGAFFKLPELLRKNPVGALSFGLFLWLMVASSYNSMGLDAGLAGLKKYRELALIPVFIALLQTATERRRVLHALQVGLGLALMVSFVQAVGLLPLYKGQAAPSSSITHGTLMAWLAFWLMHEARLRGGWVPWLGVALITVNVFLIIHATTGVVLMLAGGGLFVWQVFPLRRAATISLVLLILPLLFFFASTTFRGLVKSDMAGLQQKTEGQPAHGGVGERLEFWRNTTAIIRESPMLGHGTGSFGLQYNQRIAGTQFTPTTNPHNEYLMIWAQAGLPAVVLLVALFICQWLRSAGTDRWLAQGFVVLFAIGCAFNSFILDSREGMLFALLTAVLWPALARGCPGITAMKP